MAFAPKHVLVPIALDAAESLPLAHHLIGVAVDLAKAYSARITLLHVVPSSSPALLAFPELPSTVVQALADANASVAAESKRTLDKLAADLRSRGVDAGAVVVPDARGVAQTIADAAKERFADVVVLSTQGKKGARRLLLGSVAERVAHLCEAPVVLIRPPWPLELTVGELPDLSKRES